MAFAISHILSSHTPGKKRDVFAEAMKRIEEFEAKKDLQSASRGLAELIERHEDALSRSEPFLETISKNPQISKEKLAMLTKKVSEIRDRLDFLRKHFESVSERIVTIEKYKYPETAPISEYKDAIIYLKNERKKGNFDMVKYALHELLLKHKSALGYGENVVRKYRALEASNLSVVSVQASKRIESAMKTIDILQSRIEDIQEMLHELELEEAKKSKEEAKLRAEKELAEQKRVAENYSKEGKHSLAIGLARKLLSEHPHDKTISKLFDKIEKAFNESVKKEKKEVESNSAVDKILQEAWVDIIDSTPSNFSLQAFKESFRQIQGALVQYVKRNKNEENRKKAMKDIEKLLEKANGIAGITSVNGSFQQEIETIKAGFVRDFTNFKLSGFDFFGKILGKDEVTGDAFGFKKFEEEGRTVFYIGDATGHGIQASLTVAITSKIFFEMTQTPHSLQEIVMTVNNDLKKKIQGRYFLTGVFFEWHEKERKLRFIGGGHDPLYVYRRKTGEVEKIIPGGLAIGVRVIANIESLKIREIELEDGDILYGYTDGIIESRNPAGEVFSLKRLEETIRKISLNPKSPEKTYEALMDDVKLFQEGRQFDDDVSVYVFARNSQKDNLVDTDEIKTILTDLKASEKSIRSGKLKNMTREELEKYVEKERYELELKNRLIRLEQLYELGEFFRLKQEVIQRLKEWFVHPKMKFYLEEAMKNEQHFIRKKQDEKLARRYKTIQELYKKGQYDIVIKEALEIVAKSGKI